MRLRIHLMHYGPEFPQRNTVQVSLFNTRCSPLHFIQTYKFSPPIYKQWTHTAHALVNGQRRAYFASRPSAIGKCSHSCRAPQMPPEALRWTSRPQTRRYRRAPPARCPPPSPGSCWPPAPAHLPLVLLAAGATQASSAVALTANDIIHGCIGHDQCRRALSHRTTERCAS